MLIILVSLFIWGVCSDADKDNGSRGSGNGSLAVSNLSSPYTCAIDADDNLLMADKLRSRMTSISEDKVITTGSGYGSAENGIFEFAMNKDRDM
nr:hypothetical protein [Odoribacter splanchnicus]